MQDHAETVKIGSATYRITPLPFGQGRKTFRRVFKSVVPGVVAVLTSLGIDDEIEEALADLDGLAPALRGLFSDLPEEELEHFHEVFIPQIHVTCPDKCCSAFGGKAKLSDVAEEHFVGRYSDYYELLARSIWINYRDFFPKSLLAKAKGAVAKFQSLSPMTSTGKSGESSPQTDSPSPPEKS